MSAATTTQRLMRWMPVWRRRAAPQPDFADLGTAFGLDLATLPEPVAPPAPRAVWWQRLSPRKGSAQT